MHSFGDSRLARGRTPSSSISPPSTFFSQSSYDQPQCPGFCRSSVERWCQAGGGAAAMGVLEWLCLLGCLVTGFRILTVPNSSDPLDRGVEDRRAASYTIPAGAGGAAFVGQAPYYPGGAPVVMAPTGPYMVTGGGVVVSGGGLPVATSSYAAATRDPYGTGAAAESSGGEWDSARNGGGGGGGNVGGAQGVAPQQVGVPVVLGVHELPPPPVAPVSLRHQFSLNHAGAGPGGDHA